MADDSSYEDIDNDETQEDESSSISDIAANPIYEDYVPTYDNTIYGDVEYEENYSSLASQEPLIIEDPDDEDFEPIVIDSDYQVEEEEVDDPNDGELSNTPDEDLTVGEVSYADEQFETVTAGLIGATEDEFDTSETPDEPDPVYEDLYLVTISNEYALDNYDPAYLQELSEAGASFFALYDDGEEEEVEWTDIVDPSPENTIISMDDLIANATNQHFWDDDAGAHVAEISKEDWNSAVESDFSDLSSSKNYYNILLNSLGVLLRRALLNLVSINRTAISFYDGLGNETTNIMSYFGRNSSQIGPSDKKHIVLNNDGITAYNGDGTVAPLQASNIQAAEAAITNLSATKADISDLNAATARIGTLESTSATITQLNAEKARIDTLSTTKANVTDLNAATARIGSLEADHVSVDDLEAVNASIESLEADKADISDLNAATARIGSLEADHVSVDDLETVNASIESLEADKADISDLNAATARIGTLESTSATITQLNAEKARIDTLSTTKADVADLNAATARIGSLEADHVSVDDLDAVTADIESLEASKADISVLEADYITAQTIAAQYAQINLANVSNAWIQSGTIKDGAISSAMINTLSANKIVGGTADFSKIEVTNLKADDIQVERINGQTVSNKTLVDALSQHETDISDLSDELDSAKENLQRQIDGAIETWTGTVIPTLQNTPASAWNTNAIKDTHVGDVYFVVNSQSQQNGYNYRFTKTGEGSSATYSWQLIKDNDVTNALQRLTDAEGRIGTIETFDTTVSSFMTDTDAELTSIKSAATTLAGRVDTAEGTLATKVDTTTFNTLSQTVDGNSSSIQQLTTETTVLTSRVDDIDADIKVFNKQKETIITDTNVRSEPPIHLTVFGFSRQITTTGKNLLDYADASWGTLRLSSTGSGTVVASGGNSRRYFAVPLAAGQSVTWHRNSLLKFSGYLKLCTSYPPVVGDTISGGATITNYANYTLTNNSGEDACGILFISSKPTVANLEMMQAQLEYGSAFTSYEYCSGGVPSPSQTWPREIRVVDQLTLHFRSKNLIDISDMERGSTSSGVNSNSTTRIRLKESKKIPVIPGVEYGIGGTVTNGSCSCYIYWNDVRGYWVGNSDAWLESGSIVECPEGSYNARVLFRREDDTTVTLDDFSDLWFGPIVEYEEPIDSVVSIDLQGHELRSVYDIAEDRLIFEKQTGSTYSLYLAQETGITTNATSDGLDVIVGQNALSTTGDLSDGATVIYCLPEPIIYDLGTITLPNLSSPNIYVYGETERYTYDASYGVEIPYLEMSYWAMSIRNLVAETIEKQIMTSAKVNEVSDTVDEHTRRIGSLETTIETKADGDTVTTISSSLSMLEQDVNSFKTTVSETYSTKTELADVQNDIADIQAETPLSDSKTGYLISADRTLSAPLMHLLVRGNSMQATTTGKNLFNKNNTPRGYYNNSGEFVASDNYVWWSVPVTEGDVVRYANCQYCTMTQWLNGEYVSHSTQTAGTTYTVPSGVDEVRGYSGTATLDTAIVTKNNADLTYESYTGCKPSPNPDYPQEIVSVDAPVLMLAGKNLWTNLVTGYVNNTGTISAAYNTSLEYVTDYIPAKTGDIFRIVNLMPTDAEPWIGIGVYDASNAFINRYGWIARDKVWTVPEGNASYVRVSMRTYGYPNCIVVTQNETPITAPLYDGTLRSLSDDTKDTLSLSYLRPSTREGWAWYSRELVQIVGHIDDMSTLNWSIQYSGEDKQKWAVRITDMKAYLSTNNIRCTSYLSVGSKSISATMEDGTVATRATSDPIVLVRNLLYTISDQKDDFVESLAGVQLDYLLATPITTALDPIELPILSAPNATVWCDGGSSNPEITIDYWLNNASDIVPYMISSDVASQTDIAAITSRVSTAESTIEQHSTSIALKANSADVYTKTQSDGLISTEVTNRNAAISAATDAINLSVSQTYATQTALSSGINSAKEYTDNEISSAKAAIKITTDGISSEVSSKVGTSEIISKINQSAETVKIQASKVEIDGTAIFTAISSDVDGAITGKGYQTASQVDSAITSKGYQTSTQVESAITSKGYATTTQAQGYASTAEQNAINAIPTDISDFNNDAGFVTSADVPTKVSDLTNDSNFATTSQAQGYANTAENNAKTYAETQAGTVNSALETYKTSTNATLTSLQNQVDGQIEAWYKSVDPTASNEPASTWTTDILKARHEGDLYYNVTNGHSWRWMQSGNTYSWQQIPDSDASAALAVAQNAQTLAGSKRRIFTATPVPPYDSGDLWVDGTSIRYASQSKADNELYSESDWSITATDDSAANSFRQELEAKIGESLYPYQEVEWIQSSGQQYVYLNWHPEIATWGFDIDFISYNIGGTTAGAWSSTTNTNGYGNIFGVRNASGYNDIQLSSYGNNGLLRIGNSTNQFANTELYKTDHTRQHISLIGTTITGSNGETKTVTRLAENTSRPYQNMTIFAMHEGLRRSDYGGLIQPGSVRIYSLKFYNGSEVAVDLVPVVRLSDMVGGFWDKASEHFYPARGVSYGDFVQNSFFGEPKSLEEKIGSTVPSVVTSNTTAGRMWVVNTPTISKLEDGQQISLTPLYNSASSIETEELVGWNDTSSNTNVYISLKLADGSRTEWVPVYIQRMGTNTRFSTQVAAGIPRTLTYSENTLWNMNASGGSSILRGWFMAPVYYQDNNNYDRVLHNGDILAKQAITAKHLICGTSLGYEHVASGVQFDLGYPILFANAAIKINAISASAAYEVCPSVDFSVSGTLQGAAAQSMLYIKGTISGNVFTIATENYLTALVPSSEDGFVYIPLGVLGNATTGFFSTSNSLYAFMDGQFRQVTPSDIVSTHRIYYRTNSNAVTISAPTTWVEEATANVYNQWTTKVPPLAASTAAGQTKYLYLYTCEQRKRLDGTVLCTKVLLDENTTVIDGGSIITNSITANQIDASELRIGYSNVDNPPSIPSKTSDLTNDSGYATTTQAQGYADAKDSAISAAARRTDVSIAVTAIDYAADTATLSATLYIDGVATTSGVTYQWLRDGTVLTGSTSRTLFVTSSMGIGHVYSCTCTYS